MSPRKPVMKLSFIVDDLVNDLRVLSFGPPVTHFYNPLEYARTPYEQYLKRYGSNPKEVILLGMNPGPWGMAQTGVPFGEVKAVKEWLGICVPVDRPEHEHPRRPVLGFACPRSEVSGRRLWGLMREVFGTPEAFFAEHFVANYCPLLFLGAGGDNLTPDRLRAAERDRLFELCDAHLADLLELFEAEWGIGVGRFAEKCLQRARGRP